MIDRDRLDTRERAAHRVVVAVGAHRDGELTGAVHLAVGVARIAVGAADVARAPGGRIHGCIEDGQAIRRCRSAAADDRCSSG
jgi:hypothetical protein